MTENRSSAAVTEHEIPVDVLEYCEQHGLLPHLHEAISLAESHFSPIKPVRVVLETDPESDEQRVMVESTVNLSPQQTVERYRALIGQWIALVPSDLNYHIGFVYDIIPHE
jgi:hypothetical protein